MATPPPAPIIVSEITIGTAALAGGPLVMALILGRLGRIGKVSWRLPLSANLVMRNYGLPMLVLVVVALVVLLGTIFLRLPFPELLGIAAGATGNPAVLVFAYRLAKSDRPNFG